MLVDPRLGDHPVGPVEEASVTAREDAARVLGGNPGDLVVPAVTDVMHDHPARRATHGEGHDAHWVRADARRREADRRARLAPALHSAQVPDVLLAERSVDLAAERADVAGEPFDVDCGEVERPRRLGGGNHQRRAFYLRRGRSPNGPRGAGQTLPGRCMSAASLPAPWCVSGSASAHTPNGNR